MVDGSVMFKGVWKKMLLCIRNRRLKGQGVVMARGWGTMRVLGRQELIDWRSCRRGSHAHHLPN
jgi:hypothetical protein